MSRKRLNFLAVSKKIGKTYRPLLSVVPEGKTDAGIRFASHAIGLVPQFEVEAARIKANIRLDEWYRLDRMERALIIAHARLERAIDNHSTAAQTETAKREADREAAKHKPRGRR